MGKDEIVSWQQGAEAVRGTIRSSHFGTGLWARWSQSQSSFSLRWVTMDPAGLLAALPVELLSHVLAHFDFPHYLIAASLVCKRWQLACGAPWVWKKWSDIRPLPNSSVAHNRSYLSYFEHVPKRDLKTVGLNYRELFLAQLDRPEMKKTLVTFTLIPPLPLPLPPPPPPLPLPRKHFLFARFSSFFIDYHNLPFGKLDSLSDV